jgi:putative ABC transport system ATP-binding protein
VIIAEDIHLTYNPGTAAENHVLRGLSLRLAEGEFATLIGGNGAGKSTLLGLLCGSMPPDSGSITIDGENVTADPAWRRAARVARVFQDPTDGTCHRLSIEQNLALAYGRGHRPSLFRPALTGKLRKLLREKLAALNLGLEKRMGAPMGLLSGGQRQAISLLMASLRGSKLLLLDEHTAALDPVTADFVMELTDRIVAENCLTTLMVTHSMRQALSHGTRIIMMHRGQIALDFTGEERAKLRVSDLLRAFASASGEEADDTLLMD